MKKREATFFRLNKDKSRYVVPAVPVPVVSEGEGKKSNGQIHLPKIFQNNPYYTMPSQPIRQLEKVGINSEIPCKQSQGQWGLRMDRQTHS